MNHYSPLASFNNLILSFPLKFQSIQDHSCSREKTGLYEANKSFDFRLKHAILLTPNWPGNSKGINGQGSTILSKGSKGCLSQAANLVIKGQTCIISQGDNYTKGGGKQPARGCIGCSLGVGPGLPLCVAFRLRTRLQAQAAA